MEIEYIDYVGQHPLTSSHPHYQSLRNHAPEGIHFSSNPVENNGLSDKFNSDLHWLCSKENINPSLVADFISKIHPGSQRCPNVPLGLAPTLPYIGPVNNFLVLEDWSDIFTYLMGMHTAFVDFNAEYFNIMSIYMRMPNFKGVITHMKDTVENLKLILRNRVDNKLFYLPIGTMEAGKRIQKLRSNRLRILFTNSYGAPEGNFYVRGGVEAVQAIIELIDAGLPIDFTILGPTPIQARRAFGNRPVRIVSNFVADDELARTIDDTDIFLIPAMRVHSISVVRALCNGIVPIVSDGWGFDEFVQDKVTGLVVAGQSGHTTWKDERGIFRENYDNHSNSSAIITNIKESIQYLFDNPTELDRLSENGKQQAFEKYQLTDRNKKLKDILENA